MEKKVKNLVLAIMAAITVLVIAKLLTEARLITDWSQVAVGFSFSFAVFAVWANLILRSGK